MNGLANSIRKGGSGVTSSGFQAGPEIAAAFGSPLAAQAAQFANLKPQAVSGTCGPTTPPTDADNDKIPANFTYTYDCTVTVGAGFTFKANGPLTIVDANDNDPQSGYTTNGTIRYDFIFTNTNTGQSSSFSFIAKWNATASFGLAVAYNFVTDQRVTFQPETTRSEFSYTLTANYLPDAGTASKFEAGTINFDGRVAYSDANGKFSNFSLTTTDLHFGNACPRGVDRGTIRSQDQSNIGGNKNNVFELQATACDTWTAKYNGEILF